MKNKIPTFNLSICAPHVCWHWRQGAKVITKVLSNRGNDANPTRKVNSKRVSQFVETHEFNQRRPAYLVTYTLNEIANDLKSDFRGMSSNCKNDRDALVRRRWRLFQL